MPQPALECHDFAGNGSFDPVSKELEKVAERRNTQAPDARSRQDNVGTESGKISIPTTESGMPRRCRQDVEPTTVAIQPIDYEWRVFKGWADHCERARSRRLGFPCFDLNTMLTALAGTRQSLVALKAGFWTGLQFLDAR